MALVSNGNMARVAGMQHAGASAYLSAIPSALGSNFAGTNRQRNLTAGQGITDDTVGLPLGCLHPVAWMMPQKAGSMTMRAGGSGALSATLIPAKLMTIDLTGSGDLDATAALAITMQCAMTGSGSMSATIEGRGNIEMGMTGSGDMTADMHALANATINMLGTGDLEAAILAYGNMTIDITVTGTGLSTANVGQAVWAALDSANNIPGSMGAIMNALSSMPVQRGVALPNFAFVLVDSSDHVTPKTGATVTATRSIDGGSFAACANAVSEIGSGAYKISLDSTDTDGEVVLLKFTASGADTRFVTVITAA